MTTLNDHREAVRHALARARADGDAQTIKRYEYEVARIERLIAEGGPEGPPSVGTVREEEYLPKNLLALVLRRYLPLNDDPATQASVWMPPLPLLVVKVPEGLPAEENVRRQAAAQDRIIRTWARITAER